MKLVTSLQHFFFEHKVTLLHFIEDEMGTLKYCCERQYYICTKNM